MKWLLLLLICLFPINIDAIELPDVYSNRVMIYDLTDDEVLLEKESDERSSIASLTKIMTTITAIEKTDNFDKKVEITVEMLAGIKWDASIAGLKVGEEYTIRDLLYASMLPSGADATQALAIELSGSIKDFVDDMNILAKKIGVSNTHFVNTTGLDIDNHYSTVKDIALILKYSLNNEIFRTIFTSREYDLSTGKTVNSTLIMYNRLMNLDVSRILGSKTGYTGKAGVCIAALIESSNHEILIITLGAPYVYGDFYNLKDALALTDFVDENYGNQSIVKKGFFIKSLPVYNSKIDKYDIYTKTNIEKFLPIGEYEDKIKIVYEGKEVLNFRDIKGSKLGKISYYFENELIAEENVILEEDIEFDIFKFIAENKMIVIMVICIFIGLITFLQYLKRSKVCRFK